jgi:hypothetical protein
MRGRQKGRPTKWATASINEPITIGKAGLTVEVWQKWKKTRPAKLGTLVVSIGGLRWRPVRSRSEWWTRWEAFGKWITNAE